MEALRLQTSADQYDPKPSTPKNFGTFWRMLVLRLVLAMGFLPGLKGTRHWKNTVGIYFAFMFSKKGGRTMPNVKISINQDDLILG